MSRKIIKEGELDLAGIKIPCYVLEDGTRILSGSRMQAALKMVDEKEVNPSGTRLARYLGQKSLKPFIFNAQKGGHFEPIICYKGDTKINGYEATILADICDGFLEARKHIQLSARQDIIAQQCELLMRSFARVGIIALVDEATGYQYDREKDELQKILKAYIAPELLPWQKKFPDEFYKEIFRLNNWNFTVSGIQKRPGVIGTWTKNLIYNLLPKGVLQKLEEQTPKSAAGNKTARLHQSLTVDIGNPHLEKQLISVMTLMNISTDWKDFEKHFVKKFYKELLELPPQRKIRTTYTHPSQPSLFDGIDLDQLFPKEEEIQEAAKEPKKLEDASFSDIMGAVLKVPPPKKDKTD